MIMQISFRRVSGRKLKLCPVNEINLKAMYFYWFFNDHPLTMELAIGNSMPNVNIPSKGPAVIPDKLLPA